MLIQTHPYIFLAPLGLCLGGWMLMRLLLPFGDLIFWQAGSQATKIALMGVELFACIYDIFEEFICWTDLRAYIQVK